MQPSTWVGPLKQVLFAPDAFFAARTPREGVAGHVVSAVAVLHLLVYFGIVFLTAFLISAQADSVGMGALLNSIMGDAISQGIVLGVLVFVNWLLVSAVLHVVMKLRHGEGTFGDTLFVVGWSSPVALLALFVAGTGLVLAVQGLDPTRALDAQARGIGTTIRGAGTLGALVVLAWQAYIWPAGLTRTHDVRRDPAVQATIATVLIGALVVFLGA